MNIAEILKLNYIQIIIIIVATVILFKIIDMVFKHIQKRRPKTVYISFFRSMVQTLLIIMSVIKIGSYSSALKQFSNTILMSSSLLIVVLGFVFQEGLSNIVHGFILLIFKPFEVGDRIQTSVNGDIISGYVSSMNLRHTKVISVMDNAPQIIPNSKMDIANIKNFSNGNDINKYPLKIDITYADGTNKEKRELAKEIMRNEILNHRLTLDIREDKKIPIFVKVELTDCTVKLTSWVITSNYDDNIIACSEIAESILDEFTKNGIDFAFPHQEISGSLNINQNDLSNPTYIKKVAEDMTAGLFKKKPSKNTKA